MLVRSAGVVLMGRLADMIMRRRDRRASGRGYWPWDGSCVVRFMCDEIVWFDGGFVFVQQAIKF
jgi:hypothetical protein